MPWTEQLPSGKYRGCWRDAAGRKRSRAPFTQRAEAMRYAGQQETETRGGRASYVGRSITWGAWCDTWVSLRRVERASADSDHYRLERWLRPRWGTTPLARIDAEDVQAWVNDLSAQMAPASVAKVYGLLRSSLLVAVRYKRLAVTPCVGVELPHVPPSDERFLTRGEVDLALHHIRPLYAKVASIVLVGTGMRYGEVAGLHRHRIDWQAQMIDVHETWDGEVVKAYPKGRKKRRVPMPSWVAAAILSLPDGAKTCGLPHGDGRACRSDLVLRGPLGAPLDARNMLRRHWGPALQRAGLEHARQHDLRHTYASWLAQSGRSMTEIAAVLGHSETAVTARYAHLGDTHMEAVRQVMEGYIPGAAPYPPHDLDLGHGPDRVVSL